MSRDYWLGMATIPAVIALLAIAAAALIGFIWAVRNVHLPDWKLWPRNPYDKLGNRVQLATTVATARAARYLWIPGWHLIVCRTRVYSELTGPEHNRRSRVEWALREALAKKHRDHKVGTDV